MNNQSPIEQIFNGTPDGIDDEELESMQKMEEYNQAVINQSAALSGNPSPLTQSTQSDQPASSTDGAQPQATQQQPTQPKEDKEPTKIIIDDRTCFPRCLLRKL